MLNGSRRDNGMLRGSGNNVALSEASIRPFKAPAIEHCRLRLINSIVQIEKWWSRDKSPRSFPINAFLRTFLLYPSDANHADCQGHGLLIEEEGQLFENNVRDRKVLQGHWVFPFRSSDFDKCLSLSFLGTRLLKNVPSDLTIHWEVPKIYPQSAPPHLSKDRFCSALESATVPNSSPSTTAAARSPRNLWPRLLKFIAGWHVNAA